jgi:sugar lactone lactonase YvrE
LKFTNNPFTPIIVASLGTFLAAISAQGGGLAFDESGNLFVADGHSIVKFTPEGTKSAFATGLKNSSSLAFDTKGNLFVSDIGSQSIYKFAPEGKKSTFVTGIRARAMASDRSGNLFVGQGPSASQLDDENGHLAGLIFKFAPDGTKSTFASGFGNLMGLAFDAAGNLFVVDCAVMAGGPRRIFKFSPDGTRSTFANGLHNPCGLAIDASGNVYVAEVTAPNTSSHAIIKFSPGGTKSAFTSVLGNNWDWDLAVDRSGNVFVWNDQAVLKIDSSGATTTFASDWVSPDQQWEYKLVDGYYPEVKFPEIVKAGTTQVVLDLDKELKVSSPEGLNWAPDSKRFAFTYSSPPHARHTTYVTVAFYQLRGEKWIALHSPVDEQSKHSQLAELAKKYSPKNVYRKGDSSPARDDLEARSWTDANTVILYAHSEGNGGEAAALFTLNFDEAGNWKIVKTHRLSKKELQKEL